MRAISRIPAACIAGYAAIGSCCPGCCRTFRPGRPGKTLPNTFSLLDRWKIFDNLRRSLVAPALLVLLVAAWLGLIGSPLFWTLIALAVLGFPLFLSLLQRFAPPRIDRIGARCAALTPPRRAALAAGAGFSALRSVPER